MENPISGSGEEPSRDASAGEQAGVGTGSRIARAGRTASETPLVQAFRRGWRRIVLIAGAAAAVIAFGWPFAEFGYTNFVVPASLPASVAVTADLTPLPGTPTTTELGGLTGVRADIRVENFGQRRILVLGVWLDLWGQTYEARPSAPRDVRAAVNACAAEVGGLFARPTDKGDLISNDRFMDGWWLDPGGSSTVKEVFFLDEDRYDLVRMDVNLLVAKAAALSPMDAKKPGWAEDALEADTSTECAYRLHGSLAEDPLIFSSWRGESQSLLPWAGDDRGIAVEWRSTHNARINRDGKSPTGVFNLNCEHTVTEQCKDDWRRVIGSPHPDAEVSLLVGLCERERGGAKERLAECRPLETLSEAEEASVVADFGLTRTRASTKLALLGGVP
jgi:hypothetical protein